jgi:hypothetical protein
MTRKVTLLDLTVGQVADIEDKLELPLNRWQAEAPKATLYSLMLSASNDEPVETYRAMTLRELVQLVSIDPEDADDPTPPSEH